MRTKLRLSKVIVVGSALTIVAMHLVFRLNNVYSVAFEQAVTTQPKAEAQTGAPWDLHGKLQVSANGHYIEHADGTPFFWFGDTAWTVFHRLNTTEAELYLSDRKNKRFNVIQSSVLGVGAMQGFWPEHNLNSKETPFHNTGSVPDSDPKHSHIKPDPTNPNEQFFIRHVDPIIDLAAQHNIYVALLPIWGEYVCCKSNGCWHDGPAIFTERNARIYGEWIGDRYRDKPNIIWVLGGDRNGDMANDRDAIAIHKAMGEGIKTKDPNHLITYHPGRPNGSYKGFHDHTWLDINMIATSNYHEKIHETIFNVYYMQPPKPIVNGEPEYYTDIKDLAYYTPRLSDQSHRAQIYRTFLSGGVGYTYGQMQIWEFDKKTDGNDKSTLNTHDQKVDWFDYLDTNGTIWAVNARDLFGSIKWHELIPDQSIIESNEGYAKYSRATRSYEDYRKVAAGTPRGDLLLIYFPYTSTDTSLRSATIDLTKVTRAHIAKAKWWNPIDKSEIAPQTVSTLAAKSFRLPSDWEDGLLVITSLDPS